jgi:two-component system phosphate regulon sensor histidine kinase PhoR
VRQRNELEALLAAMIEGVLAVDMDLHVFKTNAAAEQLLGIPPGAAQGHDILELVRNPEFHDLIRRTIESEQPVEGEIILYGKDKRVLQIHGTALPDAHGRIAGAVIVLNDITRIKDLENMRRDFVANVSHELKTPITSIQGFVETLQDGAMASPGDAARFLEIIAHHSERLNAIIDDLLSLSRIERLDDKDLLNAEPGRVRDILESAILNCAERAAASGIAIELECPPDLSARMNPRLLEQAVANLIDNAIKYSEPETAVNVEAHTEGDDVVIHVRDHGRGIAREHLPRLFERFYRVDKARSRTLGGTGLGLAIVKHIAMAHGGFASVTSAPGKGSDFIIKFPAK